MVVSSRSNSIFGTLTSSKKAASAADCVCGEEAEVLAKLTELASRSYDSHSEDEEEHSQAQLTSTPTESSAQSVYSFGLICAALASVLTCSFPAGYNLGVVNTPQTILKEFINHTYVVQDVFISNDRLELVWSVVVASFLVGAIVGSAIAAWLADRLGRKSATVFTAVLGLASGALFGSADVAQSLNVLIAGRIVAGVHCGICSSLTPMYLMEISPSALKSAIGVLHCLGMSIGMFVAQVLGQASFLGTASLWPALLSVHVIVIIAGLIPMSFSPESPVHLYINRGNEQQTKSVLTSLLKRPTEVEAALQSLKNDRKALESSQAWTMFTVITSKQLRKPLFLICVMHIGQQMSGINAVFYYSTMTFTKVGMTVEQSQLASIGAGGLNMVVAMIAVSIVAKVAQKSLMLMSCCLSCVILVILTVSITLQDIPWMGLVTVCSMLGYVCVYGVGLGPIPYMAGSELFESGPRAVGMSLGCLSNWTFNFVIALCFPILQNIIGQYVFFIFAACCALTSVIVYVMMPRPKDINIDSQDDLIVARKLSLRSRVIERV